MMTTRILAGMFLAGMLPAQWSEKELALGKRVAADFEKQYRRLDVQQVTDYLKVMAGRLTPFTADIVVLDTDEKVRANLPGGRVYISTGLMLAQPDEASLALEVGHQIAHLSSRHGLRELAKAEDGAVPLVMIGWPTICARPGGEASVPTAARQAAKREEGEAMATAASYVTDAGYRKGDSQTQFNAIRQLLQGPRPKRTPTLKRAEER